MSSLTCIALCILISFVTSVCFMSVYKEDISDELHTLKTRLNDTWTQICILQDQAYVYNAKIYDLENKIKEMENRNDS